ncbi:MAG: YeeE/YedE family protein [Sphingomonadales bacterium]|nr:YeeE/YedE family protein [Sphingomonadales bacterium]MDE2568383.1 YeeE/YedE family protein [Sphingomonadales bacterium]
MFEPFLLPLAGGVLIGLAAGGLYLFAGEIAGITGIARVAMIGPKAPAAQGWSARSWAVAFLAGLFAAGLGARLLGGADFTAGIGGVAPGALLIGGLLVGIGTDLGNGCTSGHGVCGLSRLSKRSLAAVATFMIAAALTVLVARHGGL